MGVMDRYNERNKKKDEKNTGGKPASGGVAERYEKRFNNQTSNSDTVENNPFGMLTLETPQRQIDAPKNDYLERSKQFDTEISTIKNLIDRYNTIGANYGMGGEEQDESIQNERSQLLGSYGFKNIQDVEKKLEELQSGKWKFDNKIKYDYLFENADYADQSKVATTEKTAGFGIGIGTSWLGKGDPVYDYINDLEGARAKNSGSALSGGTPYSIYDYMEPWEISDYNYLYNTEGKDSAKEYLKYLEYTLNARRTGTVKENAAKLADEHPGLSSVLSVPSNLMGGVGAMDIAGQNIVKGVKESVTGEYAGPVDYNRATMTPSTFATSVRETVSQNIIDSTGVIELDQNEHPILSKLLNGKSWADVYQLGMSMADSATIALMAPYVGTAGVYLLGGSAATQGMLDAVSKGATDGQALTMGILNGAFEVLFEKYELEHLLGADSNVLKALVNQALTEGVGEGATTIANNVADVLIMADKSEYRRNVAAYMEQRLSQKDAEKQALIDLAIQTGWDFVGGMASGGIMGTFASPIEHAAEAKQTYGQVPGALVDEALDINPDNAYAQKMQGRLAAGKKLSGFQLNRMVQQNEEALTAQDMTTIQTAAEYRLTELGETGDVSAIAAVLTKQAAGQKLTRAEKATIQNSKYGSQVANELNPATIRAGEASSEWAQRLDTNRINVEEYSRLVEAAQLPQEGTKVAGEQFVSEMPKMAQAAQVGAVQMPAAIDQQVTGKLTGKESLQVAEDTSVTESQYEVSTDGKAEIGGNAVVLNGFKKMEDGSVAVVTADNQTADPSEVKYPSKEHALVYEVYANLESTARNPVIANMDVDTRSILAKAYDPASGVSAKAYVVGSNQAYWYGFEGITMDEKTISQNSLVRNITGEQRALAYDLGRKAGKQAAATQDAGIKAAYEKAVEKLGGKEAAAAISKKNKGKVMYEDALRKSSMTNKQRASTALAEYVAKATGANIHVYHGMNEYGKYDPDTGEIWLNINGNFKGSSMMAFTLAHELVHMAKQWSPAEFKAFADYLLEQYGKKGVSVEALIQEQMANAKQNGYTLDEHAAYEEVIADACQRMLLDSDAVQKMAGYKEQNPSKWQQIVEAIRKFIGNIRKLFAGAEADSMEASIYKEFDEDAKQFLEKLFVDMVMGAGEHMSTIYNAFGKGTVVEVNTDGEFTLAKGEDSSGVKKFLYNDYTWERGGRETLQAALEAEGYSKEDIKAALTIMDGKHALVKELAKQFPEQDRINQATVTTDLKNGHSVLSALVSNGDYPVNIDLLMVCKKRKAYQRVINRLCETGLIQQATVDALAIAEINKILGKYGFETACLGCFVESRRLRIQEWANTIVKEWNAEVKKRNPEAKAFGFGKGEGTLTPDEVMQLIGELETGGEKNDQGNLNLGQGSAVKRMGVLLDKVPSLRKTLSVEDLITPDGLTALRKFDSNLFSMVKSRYGSNSPKFVQEFNPYNHELAMYGKVPSEYKSLREYLYAIGGARMQSFSDFIVENWFDYCQIVADLSARKLPMHTYTKEIALAKLFGQTGIKINMSLIPDIDRSLGKEFAGLTRNENGELELIWADKDRFKATGGKSYMQSINFADAVALQNDPRYSSNVGTIAVGVSDKHILTMLDDARVRMIIPYHSSGMNPIFADMMGTSYYKDYTMFQNTTVKQLYNSKGEPASVKLEKAQNDKLVSGFQFNEVLQELGDARAAAQAYKDWCADASKHTITIKGETYTAELTPKFDSFSWHENYYKLLEDFNTYDSISEKAAPQVDVQQIYPENFSQILTDELKAQEGHRQKQAESQAFDKAMGEIESYLQSHTKADTVFYAEQHGINLTAKDKKLSAADKQKLADLRKNEKYSMPKVEEKKDLVAFHNITPQLLQDALNRNGLLMPSLAITNKGMNDFGEISLLFDKRTIDPDVNSENKLYGADAWTPTQTRLKKNAKFDTDKTVNAVNIMKRSIGQKYVSQLFNITAKQFRDTIIKADGSIYDAYAHDIGVQTAYAMEHGFIDRIPTKQNGAVDKVALQEQLNQELDTDNGWRQYKRWLGNISDTIITSYDNASNEEILNNMKAQPASAKTFKLSETGELVVPAAEYGSINEVRKNKGRLSENAAEATKAVADEFLSLAKQIDGNTKKVVNAINAAFADRYSASNIVKTFDRHGINISYETASELQDQYKKAVELPTQYFEAKPQREVGLDEIRAVVIPANADYADLKEKLEGLGIEVIEYDGSKESRVAAVNSVEKVKFSMPKVHADAIEKFGTTTDFEEAGFILPNGEMLKFTDDNHRGERRYDHRAIGIVYGVDVNLSVNHGFNKESGKFLDEFVENGGIRFDSGNPSLNMDIGLQLSSTNPLTKAQEQVIRDLVDWKVAREIQFESQMTEEDFLYRGPLAIRIDFGGDSNYAVGAVSAKDLSAWGKKSLEYEGGNINASRIIADIRHYYQTGETRKPSSIAKFRYSMPKVMASPTYEELVAKDPISVIDIGQNKDGKSYAELKDMVLKEARERKLFDAPHPNKDTDVMIFLTEKSFTHAFSNLTSAFGEDTILAMGHIPEIIHEAVLTHIASPKNPRKAESRVFTFFAAIEGKNGVEPVKLKVKEYVDKKTSEIPQNIRRYFEENGVQETHNRLYDAKALEVIEIDGVKKESGASASVANRKRLGAKGTPNSTIKVADLLGLVNEEYQKYIPLPESGRNKQPSSHGMSSRELLADAFDELVQTRKERELMDQYRNNITKVEEVQERLKKLRGEISRVTKAKGDKAKIAELNKTAAGLADLIDRYDRKLLEMEASKPLRDVLARARSAAYHEAKRRGEEAMKEYRQQVSERFDRGVEGRRKTEMRHKIQKVVKELNDLLLNESKNRHVPDSLKKSVADALSLVNMDTVEAEQRAAKYAELIAKEQSKAEPNQDKIDAYTATMENILRQGDKMGQRLKELRDAYEEIQNSDDPDIANSYDPVIAGAINELSQTVGNTSIRNMTLEQLSDVYDVYRMVLTRVREANNALLENIKESISMLATGTIREVRMAGGEHTHRAAILDPAKKFLWNNLKPVYAMEMIGSPTLTKVFNNVRAGEDTWAKDVTEAREFYLDKSKKYGYDSWDFKKKFRFESASGQEFELTLEQMLSLYAYSKREQAHDHLRLGGFVFDSNIETYKDDNKVIKYKVNIADAHQITPEILGEITGKLTKEQMGFVDEMQEYLSTVMGAKGNEVTSKMYGVKLFKEKFYFPLKSAKQFMFEQNEVSGEVKIKNSGFTNKVVAKANNPVILSNFMDVWAGHVNDMSMYHAFTLPLEDFNRVFNYNSPKQEGRPPVAVKGTIQNAYGPAAVDYVKNLITDLNGGARTDSTTGFINKAMGLFKKGSVFASMSVVIQQPSAIARAAALVDTKYFIGPKIDHKTHKLLWDEVKKYAPVAIIKEMGYFDTNMGKSTQDFIQGKEYSGFKAKMKAMVTDGGYRDEVLSKAPALADEIAWCGIWEAVKRETKANNPGVDVKSEAFLQMVGERFTEVITKTQVYDSVLSRSGNMRSKDTGMKMATAFMAEPTTSINMIADALLKGKRGNRKYARKAIGAVIASQLLNAILVSFVYAGRDDDEDETYAEKYIGSVTGEFLDSLNPATYIPFIKDIVSIVQGYDVERSDMAVISDLWKSIENLRKDNVSAYRKVEGFAGSIAQIFGLPLKNIMRDVRGIYQTVESFVNGQHTTGSGIKYAVKGSVTRKDVSDQQQLYEAYLSGDQAHIDRVKGRYKDQSAVNSAIRMALRENDPRIHDAAIAWNANDLDEYMRIAKEIIAEKHFVQDDVVMAIRAEASALEPDEGTSGTSKAKGLFTEEKFAEAIAQGNAAMANAAKADIIKTAMLNGKTRDEAEKSFATSASSKLKEQFLAGNLSENETVNALTTYCGKERDAAMADVQYWAFKQEYPETYADDQWFDTYYEKVADSGLDIEVYMEYRNAVSTITGDGKKERRMEVIHSLPISKEQKDALYLAEGWAESKLYEAPWH